MTLLEIVGAFSFGGIAGILRGRKQSATRPTQPDRWYVCGTDHSAKNKTYVVELRRPGDHFLAIGELHLDDEDFHDKLVALSDQAQDKANQLNAIEKAIKPINKQGTL